MLFQVLCGAEIDECDLRDVANECISANKCIVPWVVVEDGQAYVAETSD
jgi:hypothetical protein